MLTPNHHHSWLLLPLSLLLIVTIPTTCDAYNFSVTNKAPVTTIGGLRYAIEIGERYSKIVMAHSASTVLHVLGVHDGGKPVKDISLTIEEDLGQGRWAYVSDISNIHISGSYIGSYKGRDVKKEFSGLIYHCMTLVLQWNGNGQAPTWLLTGIADFVRVRAHYPGDNWVNFGKGDKWDQGYDVTTGFLIYCELQHRRFVAKLNKKMKYGYNDGLFQELTGKSIAQLWSDYKSTYGNFSGQ
ncbi:unnamed protein product [Linum tenue]|uniref:Uncharacterized protein n=1 Tax=Linum tenue TaxID=586396 RepID=A0AAV0MHH5_9ROSI|nr:unnamed protein product [Linum tenue]